VLAFEVAQYLHKNYGVEIPDLFISSAKNPNELTSLNRDKFGDKMFKMSDRALWSRMGDMGGIPEDLIESRKDLMKLSVPGFRADCHMLEHYVMYDGLDPPAVTLSANITSIWAKQDKYITHQDSLTGWTFVTKGKHTHISLSKGNHHDCLLVPDNQEALLGAAVQKLHEGQLQADDEASTCSLGMLSI
jgi:surfactin synthase thioesterase subunit